jgi:hypothetical protein
VDNPRSHFWNPEDLSAVLSAIEKHGQSRRQSQAFNPNLLEFFPASEWAAWKSQGLANAEGIVIELLARIKSIGGKNLSEHSKKLAMAIWVFLRGDGRSLGFTGRGLVAEQFKSRCARSMRDFEPAIYLEQLPRLEEYRVKHAIMFMNAYPTEQPQVLDASDVSEIMYIDSLFKCRGIGQGAQHDMSLQQHVLAKHHQQQPEPFGGQLSNAFTQFAMQQFASMMSASTQGVGIPGFRISQPLGRPMRSVANVNASMDAGGVSQALVIAPPPESIAAPPPIEAPPAPHAAAHLKALEAAPSTIAALPNTVSEGSNATLVPAIADHRDEVEAVMERMLKRKARKLEDDEDVEIESENDTSLPKPNKCNAAGKAKTKAKAKTPSKSKSIADKATPSKKSAAWPCPPKIGWETSRNQVMCRRGQTGAQSTKKITFAEAGGAKKAWRLAETWLIRAMKEYNEFKKNR